MQNNGIFFWKKHRFEYYVVQAENCKIFWGKKPCKRLKSSSIRFNSYFKLYDFEYSGQEPGPQLDGVLYCNCKVVGLIVVSLLRKRKKEKKGTKKKKKKSDLDKLGLDQVLVTSSVFWI